MKYAIAQTSGKQFLINGKSTSDAEIGNADHVLFISNGDTATLEAMQMNFMQGTTDTIHVEGKEFKARAGNGTQAAFTLSFNYNFHAATTAVIDKRFDADVKSFAAGHDSSASIQMKSYEPNHLVYESNSNRNQLAVFSEIYYQPGWVSTIDGKETPHVRANYVLRAMMIPAA